MKKKLMRIFLAIAMVFTIFPAITQQVGAKDGDSYKYNILHLDAGRKYFSPDNIKALIDVMAESNYNQLSLYLSDNQGFRFALDDMVVTTDYGTYDLTASLGDGYIQYNSSNVADKTPDGSGKYLTQSEMDEIISYARSKGIDIVPCINTPGHMGAILENFDEFCYGDSKSSIDLSNEEAVAFALGIVEKYVSYFSSRGVSYFNLGADEYANDLNTMGFEGMGNTLYTKFVSYLNEAASIVKEYDMTPRAFNDGIEYKDYSNYGSIDKDIEVYYWSSGWYGYDVAAASTLASNYSMINTNGEYYWILGNESVQCSAEKAAQFSTTTFSGSTVNNPVGSMFCIWCDYGDADGTDDGAGVVSKASASITAFGNALPEVESTLKDLGTAGNGTILSPYDLTVEENANHLLNIKKGTSIYLTTGETTTWNVVDENVATVTSADVISTASTDISANVVSLNAINEGATVLSAGDATYEVSVVDAAYAGTITVQVGKTKTISVNSDVIEVEPNATYASAKIDEVDTSGYSDITSVEDIATGKEYLLYNQNVILTDTTTTTNSTKGLSCTTFSDSNTYEDYMWKVEKVDEGYTISKNSKYLSISGNNVTLSDTPVTLTLTNANGGINIIGSSTGLDRYSSSFAAAWTQQSTNANQIWTLKEVQTGYEMTITGNAIGTTEVTVGDAKYIINVVEKDYPGLEIEYWITNRAVTPSNGSFNTEGSGDNLRIYSTITYDVANVESGVQFTSLIASLTGTSEGNTMVYWKGTHLDGNSKQTASEDVDKTKAGNDFSLIRFWNEKWEISSDGITWVEVVYNGDTQYDQIVAYYLQKTDVTDEIETQVVDWGKDYSTYGNQYTWAASWCVLDFAVQYESGNRIPTSFPVKTDGDDKTMIYHCDPDSTMVTVDGATRYRTVGAIKAENTSQYEIYMITLTPTSDTITDEISRPDNASYVYSGTEKVVWVDDTANLGIFVDSSLQHEDFKVGGEAIVDHLNIYNHQGMLVTYYVRAKVTEDSLTVNYIDENTGLPLYSYTIAVNAGTLFDENVALDNPWQGPLVNGTVTNVLGKTETVTADLGSIPPVGSQYKNSDYICTKMERVDAGKTLNLYYNFSNSKVEIVVDYGLGVKVTKDIFGLTLNEGENIINLTISNPLYGTVTIDSTDYSFTYTQNTMMKGMDQLIVTYRTSDNSSITYMLYIYPATTVYYEDAECFVEYTDSSRKYDSYGSWGVVDENENATTENYSVLQHLDELGDNNANIYGYDEAYKNMKNLSMGTAHKVSVDATTGYKGYGPYATFTFAGTGFDLISLTDNNSGLIKVTVTNVATNEVVKTVNVNNYYGYYYNGEEWVATSNTDETNTKLYQVPVIQITDLTYGTYNVKVELNYLNMMNATGDEGYSFWLDAIRIYDPVGNALDTKYAKDGEANPDFIELRDVLLDANDLDATTTVTDGVVFVDSNNEGNITEYQNVGPNNEVYLANGQSIAFEILAEATSTPSSTLQIGAKLVNGDSVEMKVITKDSEGNEVSSTATTIQTDTDMNYELNNISWKRLSETSNIYTSGVIVIKNNNTSGGSILSLTNLKAPEAEFVTNAELTSSVDVASISDSLALDENESVSTYSVMRLAVVSSTNVVDEALEMMDESFVPTYVDAKWTTVAKKAILTVTTSTDVTSISVDGNDITAYKDIQVKVGFGKNKKTETKRIFTYTINKPSKGSYDYEVIFYDIEGNDSEPVSTTLTVGKSIWEMIISWWR